MFTFHQKSPPADEDKIDQGPDFISHAEVYPSSSGDPSSIMIQESLTP